MQAHGAVLHDAAFGLEEEQVVEVEVGAGVTHVFACERPLLERGASVEAAMGRLVVLALDPGPEAAVARVQQAIARRGLPARLFVDNGANFPSQQIALVCAKLSIALIHARPYQPAGSRARSLLSTRTLSVWRARWRYSGGSTPMSVHSNVINTC